MSPARKRVTSGVPFEQAVGYSRAVAAGEFIFVSG
jgi:enamine deaminase RidA (YjgF/YER057c/UK114 family)